MSFRPVVPLSGYGAYAFVKRTMDSQKSAFEAAPVTKRDEDYFRSKIGGIKTAEALVADRRLLKIALGAFGLDADINNKYFIRKVLEGSTLDEKALGNRLANKQYQKLSKAFGFGDFAVPRTQLSDFATIILKDYKTRQFEIAVGEQNGDMRLVLNAERELAGLAKGAVSDETKWFTVMGNTPLRQVFQTAFGLPAAFAAIDLDQQLETLRSKADQAFGDRSIAQFADPARVDLLVRRFLARSDAATGPPLTTKGMGALQLLQAGQQSSGQSILSLLR